MPGKERSREDSVVLLENEFRMRNLMESFGNEKWKYSQFWANQEGEFVMMLVSPGGRRRIEYQDLGKGPGGSSV
ncbi:MAG TPA: hypothetical protein VKC54_04490, partial [Patescibacteria group bacterium]|nr:hypothetical protein [Patescibacteria group bacterium]